MIAPDDRCIHGNHTLANFVRAGVVPNDVAEVHDPVIGRRTGHARLKRLDIGMNVAEYKKTHD